MRIAVLESRFAGFGASGRNGGWLANTITAFLMSGLLGTFAGRCPVWIILSVPAAIVVALSFKLRSDSANKRPTIDGVDAVLIGVAIVTLILVLNNLNAWGVLVADPGAPLSVLGL